MLRFVVGLCARPVQRAVGHLHRTVHERRVHRKHAPCDVFLRTQLRDHVDATNDVAVVVKIVTMTAAAPD
jgi:hypothetical protein